MYKKYTHNNTIYLVILFKFYYLKYLDIYLYLQQLYYHCDCES